MNFDKPSEKNISGDYQKLLQEEIDSGNATSQEAAMKIIELNLFNERIGQFKENDLKQDADGSWDTFEQKIRDVFPEIPDNRFRSIKAAVSMHLCGL